MGDPRKHRKKYTTPTHPWQKTRIVEESKLVKDYGLANKREIWKASSKLAKMKDQVKILATDTSKQADRERELLMKKVRSLGLLDESGSLSDILSLETKDFLERRLQTFVFRQGWAKSILQARQFIVHEHITVNGKKITVPSYIIREDEKTKIGFSETSSIFDPEHPERKIVETEVIEKKANKTEDKSKKKVKATKKTSETKPTKKAESEKKTAKKPKENTTKVSKDKVAKKEESGKKSTAKQSENKAKEVVDKPEETKKPEEK